MSELTHSPHPWHQAQNGSAVYAKDGSVVAWLMPHHTSRTDNELIQYAPEVFAAMRKLLEAHSRLCDLVELREGRNINLDEQPEIKECRRLIAKIVSES